MSSDKPNPFAYINAINSGKRIPVDKTYSPFMTNRALSYFTDTLFQANLINQYAHLDPYLQFEYLINTVEPRKRFAKWAKKPKADSDIEAIAKYFQYNLKRAEEVTPLLSESQMQIIREHNKGA